MRVYGRMWEVFNIKGIERLGKVAKEVEIVNRQTVSLDSGRKVHLATIKRDRPVTNAK